MLGQDGNYFTDGPKGVVRLTQLDSDQCVIEGTVDGLTPGLHGLAIHETGDTSEGCASLGNDLIKMMISAASFLRVN